MGSGMALLKHATLTAVVVFLIPVVLVIAPQPAGACSLFLRTIDLDQPHQQPHLDSFVDSTDRFLRVETVAVTPQARDFHRGGVVVGTHQWQVLGEAKPFTLVIDDGRDMRSENNGCWNGADVPAVGSSFVIGVNEHENGRDVAVTIHGDDTELSARLGEPTAIPADDAEISRLIEEVQDSRPMAARISVLIPLGLWTPVVLIAGLVLGMSAHRKRTKPQSVGGLAAP